MALDLDALRSALCERPLTAATQALANYPREGVVGNGVNHPYAPIGKASLLVCQGDSAKARTAFTAARKEVEEAVESSLTSLPLSVCWA